MASRPLPTASLRFIDEGDSVVACGRSVIDILAVGRYVWPDISILVLGHSSDRRGPSLRIHHLVTESMAAPLPRKDKKHPRTGDKHHELDPERMLRSHGPENAGIAVLRCSE